MGEETKAEGQTDDSRSLLMSGLDRRSPGEQCATPSQESG